jgi:group II intron reverse transcriptase/maturase
VHIPKGPGSAETRPLGIPTFEDKVLQRAVVMALEPIYEQDFLDCSYGFRPGRSAHMAVQALWKQVMDLGGCWVLEVDIRKFFDTLDRAPLRQLLRQRVRDGVLLRLIDKWLKAGFLEEGELTHPEAGTPQGGVISPLLANVYLHYVLDMWFEREVKPRLKGRAFLVRYADDFVMGFACEGDARRVLAVLPQRLGKYGLQIHSDKTRLVPFARPTSRPPGPGQPPAPPLGSFDFLGFTHVGGRQPIPPSGPEDRGVVPAQPSPADPAAMAPRPPVPEELSTCTGSVVQHQCPPGLPTNNAVHCQRVAVPILVRSLERRDGLQGVVIERPRDVCRAGTEQQCLKDGDGLA